MTPVAHPPAAGNAGWELCLGATEATGIGAELSRWRGANARHGFNVAAQAAGVMQRIAECGFWSPKRSIADAANRALVACRELREASVGARAAG